MFTFIHYQKRRSKKTNWQIITIVALIELDKERNNKGKIECKKILIYKT